jgi:hypothetical protein
MGLTNAGLDTINNLRSLFSKGRLRVVKVGNSRVLQGYTLGSPDAPADWCGIALVTEVQAEALADVGVIVVP